jgi:hypothetical protein
MVWAVGVMMGAALLAMVGLSASKTAVESASTVAAGAASGNIAKLATGPADYATDLLLRPQPGQPAGATAESAKGTSASSDDALRAETTRIFMGAIKSQAITPRDRTYLTQTVATRTGLSEDQAQKRVDAAITEARDLELKAREQADKARKAAVITAFIAAMSLLVSLVVAAAAAAAGGRHRDEDRIPMFAGHRFW